MIRHIFNKLNMIIHIFSRKNLIFLIFKDLNLLGVIVYLFLLITENHNLNPMYILIFR